MGVMLKKKMGSGVAAQIKERYPKAYADYITAAEDEIGLRLGRNIWVGVGHKVIINSITQEFYGREPGRVYVSYDAIRECIKDINIRVAKLAENPKNLESVAFPLIGAGLAQGKWSIISQIIEEESTNFQPVVYLFDGIIPDGVIAEIVKAD